MDWNDDARVQEVAAMVDTNSGWNLILGSDLVYTEDGLQDLAKAMAILLSHHHHENKPSDGLKISQARLIYAHTEGRLPDLDDLWKEELNSKGLEWTVLATVPVFLNGAPWEGRRVLIMDISLSKVMR